MSSAIGVSPVVLAYAQALFNVAKKQGIVQQMTEECKRLQGIFEAAPHFARFLEAPQVSRAQKREVITRVLGSKINPLTLNLFNLAIQRERAGLLPAILAEFQNVAERADGIFPAHITSARELGFQEKVRIKASLERFAKCQLRIVYDVRPDIRGGVIFRFQDSLVDASIQNKLVKLARHLKGGTVFTRIAV
jgi:F-type H+-transporting ATPase subunit delta